MKKKFLEVALGTASVLGLSNINETSFAEEISKADIQKFLKNLEKDSTLKEEKLIEPGAMCYKMAPPIDYKEYICPVCGHRRYFINELDEKQNEKPERAIANLLLLEKNMYKNQFFKDLEAIKFTLSELQKLGLNCKIDERILCDHCRKHLEEKFKNKSPWENNTCGVVIFEVSIDNSTTRTLVTKEDLSMLKDFLQEKHKTQLPQDCHPSCSLIPLYSKLSRIREILGVDDVEFDNEKIGKKQTKSSDVDNKK